MHIRKTQPSIATNYAYYGKHSHLLLKIVHIKENAAIYLTKICLLRKTQSSIYKNYAYFGKRSHLFKKNYSYYGKPSHLFIKFESF